MLSQDFAKKYKGNKGNIINIIDQRIEKLTLFFLLHFKQI